MTDNTQPEALRLVEQYDYGDPVAHSNKWRAAVCNELERLHAENAALQQGYDAKQLEIDHLRGVTQMVEPAQPVAWLVYLPSIDTQHLYYSQEDMGYVDDVTNHADAEVTPLYEMAAPKAEVAPAGEYPPSAAYAELPIPSGVSDDGYNLFLLTQMRDFADATCAMRAQAAPQRNVFDEDGFRAQVIRSLPDNTIIGKSTWWADYLAALVQRFMLAAPQPAPAPSAAADLIAALEEARSAINSMKVEAETAGQGDEQMMLEACETISNEGLQADMAIRAALASAPRPSPTPQADSVLEDAARYRWLRIYAIGAFRTNDGKGPVSVYHLSKIPAIPGIPEETDAAIDAARKQGAKP